MSLFPLAATAAGAWLAVATLGNMRQTVEVPEKPSGEGQPFSGAIGHIQNNTFVDHTRFVSVEEDRDVQGARIFWVDYGNGQRVQQYHDPRIWL